MNIMRGTYKPLTGLNLTIYTVQLPAHVWPDFYLSTAFSKYSIHV